MVDKILLSFVNNLTQTYSWQLHNEATMNFHGQGNVALNPWQEEAEMSLLACVMHQAQGVQMLGIICTSINSNLHVSLRHVLVGLTSRSTEAQQQLESCLLAIKGMYWRCSHPVMVTKHQKLFFKHVHSLVYGWITKIAGGEKKRSKSCLPLNGQRVGMYSPYCLKLHL